MAKPTAEVKRPGDEKNGHDGGAETQRKRKDNNPGKESW
jgi:hypothetical protein